jgi:site-specific recombinase XerD
MTVLDAITLFLRDHDARGSRPKTKEWYRTTLLRLLADHLSAPLDSVRPATLTEILGRPYRSQSTRANYDRALRGLFNWLHGVGELERNPFDGRKTARDSFRLREVLSAEEIIALFRVCDADKRFRYRHRALLHLFLDCGLRASEVARLTMSDVDWTAATLRVTGKTGHAGVPLTRRAHAALRLYTTRERRTTSPYVFVYGGQPLNQNALSHLIARLARRAGISRPVGTHLLRHTFATHFLRNGGDAFTLQRLMRHSSMNMTMRYVNFVSHDLNARSEQHSPLKGLQI